MEPILNWIWQGSAVAAAAVVSLRLTSDLGAAVRYRLCGAALLLILLLPLASLPEARDPAGVRHPPTAPERARLPIQLPFTIEPRALAAAWLLWVALLGARAAVDLVRLRRIRETSSDLPRDRADRLPHWRAGGHALAVRLVVTPAVPDAAVLGVRTPVIALSPRLLESLTDTQLDLVVMHEWSHLERRDHVTNVVQLLVRVAAGWHPGVWWLDRHLHVEREAACDEHAVRRTGSMQAYAACLVRLAELRLAQRAALPVPAALAASRLGDRLARLLRTRRTSPCHAALATGTVLAAVVLLTVAVADVRLVAAGATPLRVVDGFAVRTEVRLAPAPAETRVSRQAAPSLERSTALPRPAAARQSSRDPAGPSVPAVLRAGIPVAHGPLDALALGRARARPVPQEEAAVGPTPPAITRRADVSELPPAASLSSWVILAEAGSAVGKESQQAAARTARFFTSAGRRIAGAF